MESYKEKLIDAAGGYSFISITNDSSVLIEGCKQILECSEVLARVVTRQYVIEIWGSDLKLSSFNNSSVNVKGRISSLSLERKRTGEII